MESIFPKGVQAGEARENPDPSNIDSTGFQGSEGQLHWVSNFKWVGVLVPSSHALQGLML